jgi:hypothetical protein
MARAFDDIKDITKGKEVWRLAVKVEDLWSVYKGKYEDYVEMLIKDINEANHLIFCSYFFQDTLIKIKP